MSPFGIIAAYIDESSDEKQERVFAIGVLIGRLETWTPLERMWQDLLNEYDIEYYRSTEAEHARGQFDKPPFRTSPNTLTVEQNEMLKDVQKRFLALAAGVGRAGLVLGLDMRDFYAVANTPQHLNKFGGTPYYICLVHTMLTAAKAIKDNLGSRELVIFACDRQQRFSSHALNVHQDFISKNPYFSKQIGSLHYEDKEKCIPLQAADSVAYEGRKYLEAKIYNSGEGQNTELKRWMESQSLASVSVFTKEALQIFLDGLDKLNQPE